MPDTKPDVPDLSGLDPKVQAYIDSLVTKAEELTTTVTDAAKTIEEQKAEIEKAAKPVDDEKPKDDPLEKADPAIKALIVKAQEDVAAAKAEAAEANKIAKAEQDARKTAEFVALSKAEFNDLSVKHEEFGPLLKSVSEQVKPEEFKQIVDLLKTTSGQLASAGIFGELGSTGAGAIDKGTTELDSLIKAKMKADDKLDYTAAAVAVVGERPDLYNAHRTSVQKGA